MNLPLARPTLAVFLSLICSHCTSPQEKLRLEREAAFLRQHFAPEFAMVDGQPEAEVWRYFGHENVKKMVRDEITEKFGGRGSIHHLAVERLISVDCETEKSLETGFSNVWQVSGNWDYVDSGDGLLHKTYYQMERDEPKKVALVYRRPGPRKLTIQMILNLDALPANSLTDQMRASAPSSWLGKYTFFWRDYSRD